MSGTMRIRLFGLLLLVSILGLGVKTGMAGQQEFQQANELRQQAGELFDAGKPAEAADLIAEALVLRPDHPGLLINLAYLRMKAGDREAAVAALARYAAMGLTTNVGATGPFTELSDTEGFAGVADRLANNAVPKVVSRPFLTLDRRLRIAEGIAIDPEIGVIFISSVGDRQVYRIARGGIAQPFGPRGGPIMAAMGMTVDRPRGVLWLASAEMAEAQGITPSETPASALVGLDLESGRLVHQIRLDDDKPHTLGDLALGPDGAVYLTDSVSPMIFRFDPENGAFGLWLESDDFVSLQGIAFSEDGNRMYLSDYAQGILSVDLREQTVHVLDLPKPNTLLGIDGLQLYGNSLIAVQNGVNPQRILKLDLSPDGRAVSGVEILESANPLFDEPTLVAVTGDEIYFVANSHWPIFGGGGEPDEEALKNWRPPDILRLPLSN